MDEELSDSDSYDSSSGGEAERGINTDQPHAGGAVDEVLCQRVAELNVECIPRQHNPANAVAKSKNRTTEPVVAYKRTNSTSEKGESPVTIIVGPSSAGKESSKLKRQNLPKTPKSEWFLDAYDVVDSREAAIMNEDDSPAPTRTSSFTDSLRQALKATRLFNLDSPTSPDKHPPLRSNAPQSQGKSTSRQSVSGKAKGAATLDVSIKNDQRSSPKAPRGDNSCESSYEIIGAPSGDPSHSKRTSKILPKPPPGTAPYEVDGKPVHRSQSFPEVPPRAKRNSAQLEGNLANHRNSTISQMSNEDEDMTLRLLAPNDSMKKKKKTLSTMKDMSPSSEKLVLLTDCYAPYFPDFPADRRSLIALELYTTERSYVRGLEIIVDLFKRTLTGSGFFDAKELECLFSNIETILDINLEILGALAKRLEAWSDDQIVSDIFIDHEEHFKEYAIYCKTYDSGEALLKQKTKKKKELEALLFRCYGNSACQPGLTLPSYLIMVVQRIPRYILLLKDLLRKTPVGHRDSNGLSTAVALMEKLANFINEQLKQSQSQKALEALQFQIVGLKAYYMSGRVLIHEGAVSMMNIKKTYQCVLFNDLLVLAVKGSAKSEVELVLDLNVVWFEDVEDLDPQTTREDAIAIYTPDRPYTLYVGSSAEKRLWLTHLKKAIASNLYGTDANQHDIEKRSASHTYRHGSVYSGAFLTAKRHGTGMMMWPNQMTYKGEWCDNERNGVGSLAFNNGEVYEGEWLDNLEHGKGIMQYPNGDKFVGSWRRGYRHGNAEITFANGDKLICKFSNDRIEGHGTLVCQNGLQYEGEWKRNMRHGSGVARGPSGESYSGEFRYDRYHGQGAWTSCDGVSSYTGEFDNGDRHGEGHYRSPDGNLYQGSWFRGYMEGRGKITYCNSDVYEGTWIKNKRYGHGTMTWANGDAFVGQWERDHQSGSGVMTWTDGSSYDGKWLMGNRHGFGRHCGRDKSIYEGFWVDDLYHGKGVLTTATGRIFSGQWLQGKLDGSGSLAIQSSEYLYEGQWKNGVKEGHGSERHGNIAFEGEFKQDKRDGRGVETIADQMTYEGSWKRGLKHGRGVLRLFNGVAQQQVWNSGSLIEAAASTAKDIPFITRN